MKRSSFAVESLQRQARQPLFASHASQALDLCLGTHASILKFFRRRKWTFCSPHAFQLRVHDRTDARRPGSCELVALALAPELLLLTVSALHRRDHWSCCWYTISTAAYAAVAAMTSKGRWPAADQVKKVKAVTNPVITPSLLSSSTR